MLYKRPSTYLVDAKKEEGARFSETVFSKAFSDALLSLVMFPSISCFKARKGHSI